MLEQEYVIEHTQCATRTGAGLVDRMAPQVAATVANWNGI